MKKLHIELGQNNHILRTISTPLAQHELREYKWLAEAMLKYVKNPKNGWVGLAAPQVGVNKRIIVVSLMKDYDDENFRTIAMINPVILSHSEATCTDQEWCLSLPGEKWDVERFNEIELEFYNIDGQRFVMKLDKLAARIVQHEIDHLDGILFTDRISKK